MQIEKVKSNKNILEKLIKLIKNLLNINFIKQTNENSAHQFTLLKKSNILFTIQNFIFSCKKTSQENTEMRKFCLSLVVLLLKIQIELNVLQKNEYIGLFNNYFKYTIQVIQLKSTEMIYNDFISEFLILFEQILQNLSYFDLDLFSEKRNLLIELIFPLIKKEDEEISNFHDNPQEFVLYGQDTVDKKTSLTIKTKVFALVDLLIDKVDGFAYFIISYILNLLDCSIMTNLFINQNSKPLIDQILSNNIEPSNNWIKNSIPNPSIILSHQLSKFIQGSTNAYSIFSDFNQCSEYLKLNLENILPKNEMQLPHGWESKYINLQIIQMKILKWD